MKSAVVKRSVVVAGHKTSISLEDAFWNELKDLAARRGISTSDLVLEIDRARQHGNLSSAIRLFVLDQVRQTVGTQPIATSEPAQPAAETEEQP
jgi:predicted DNA-binding ribbon-helix-helix protein